MSDIHSRDSFPHASDDAAARRVPRAQAKGQQTKAAIVDAALGLAAQVGLEGLSIAGA